MSTVSPTLARYTTDVAEFIDKMYDKYSVSDSVFYEIYEPELRLYTTDGLTALFYEEGIEFYPKDTAAEVAASVAASLKEKKYVTLGDIAEELKVMKSHGMTPESIKYALDRVYWEDEWQERN